MFAVVSAVSALRELLDGELQRTDQLQGCQRWSWKRWLNGIGGLEGTTHSCCGWWSSRQRSKLDRTSRIYIPWSFIGLDLEYYWV